VSYSFDPATGTFQREASTFGQVYLDRADPIGAGRFNVSFGYQYVQLEELDGHDSDDLHDTGPIPIPDLLAAIEIPKVSVTGAVHSFLFAFTYGITDNLDAGLAVPAVYSDLRVSLRLRGAAVPEDGEVVVIEEGFDEPEHVVGPGDVLLRGRYRFLESNDLHLGAGLLVRFPSGDDEALHGIGFFEVAPSLLASTRVFEAASWARLQGHFNAALAFNADDVDASEARWGIGLDWGLTDDITVALAFLGRHQFASVAPPGSLDFPRCSSDLIECASDPSQRDTVAPLFNLEAGRPDYYTLSLGGRVAVWRDKLFVFANVAIPLNDGFIRTAPIPLAGVQFTL
jgi:hypothetical protein